MNKRRTHPRAENAFSALGERIKAALDRLTVQQVASKIGVTPSAIYNWTAGTNEPNLTKLVALAHATEISIAWLVAGEGEMRPTDLPGYIKPGFLTEPPPLAFESEWVKRNIGPSEDDVPEEIKRALYPKKPHEFFPLSLIEVSDDAMEPTLKRGDLLLSTWGSVTQTNGIYLVMMRTKPEPGEKSLGPFLIDANGKLVNRSFPRRIEWTPEGDAIAKCDNPAYPHQVKIEITDQRKQRPAVVARIVWHGRLI